MAEKSKRKNRSSSKCTALLPADNGVTEANTNTHTHRSGDDDGGGGRNGGKRRRETENENERAQWLCTRTIWRQTAAAAAAAFSCNGCTKQKGSTLKCRSKVNRRMKESEWKEANWKKKKMPLYRKREQWTSLDNNSSSGRLNRYYYRRQLCWCAGVLVCDCKQEREEEKCSLFQAKRQSSAMCAVVAVQCCLAL